MKEIAVFLILLVYIGQYPLTDFWYGSGLHLLLDHHTLGIKEMALDLLPKLFIELHQVAALGLIMRLSILLFKQDIHPFPKRDIIIKCRLEVHLDIRSDGDLTILN